MVVGSNQQSYVVPMLQTNRGSGGGGGGGGQGEVNCLAPSSAQAHACELRQVPGASDHRTNAQVYSPPEPPPKPTPPGNEWGRGGSDYAYIDEDASDDDGYSRAEIEYTTVAAGAQQQQQQQQQQQLDCDGYVEGGELPAGGEAVYAQPAADAGEASSHSTDQPGNSTA